MASTDPLWEPSLSYDETELRKMDSALVMSDGTAVGSRPGIRVGDPGLAVSLAGSTINVTAGTAALFRAGQGVYRAQLAATSPGTVATANATFARIDLVYLRVWDTAVDSSGLRKADTVYLAGTASGSPVAPTPGATEIYIPLATITVPAAGSPAPSVSAAVRQVTVAPGGILPVTSATDIALSGTYVGQTRYNTVRGTLESWTGSAWMAPGDWVTYTPTWTAGTTPAIGNGTLEGRYSLLGKQCTVRLGFIAGSTTNFGTGEWKFGLPFTAATLSNAALGWIGAAAAIRPGVAYNPGTVRITSATAYLQLLSSTAADGSTNSQWTTAVPFTWASGHNFEASIAFEIA